MIPPIRQAVRVYQQSRIAEWLCALITSQIFDPHQSLHLSVDSQWVRIVINGTLSLSLSRILKSAAQFRLSYPAADRWLLRSSIPVVRHVDWKINNTGLGIWRQLGTMDHRSKLGNWGGEGGCEDDAEMLNDVINRHEFRNGWYSDTHYERSKQTC